MNKIAIPSAEATKARMADSLALQQRMASRQGAPSASLRKDRLGRAITLLATHKEELVSALNSDFGARSAELSLLADIAAAIGPLKYARAHVDRWMKPQRRKVSPAPLSWFGARAEIRFQPKGVVGVMTPWNFPVQLAFDAIAAAVAAGNSVMLKPSELTPATSALLARLIDYYFNEDEIATFTGGPEVGAAFAGLAFDHLIFTGSTQVGRHVMRAAADNLTPVTLELGGKCPVVIGASADLELAAARVMSGKTMNAGQICLAPDYVLAPAETFAAFVDAARRAVAAMYPKLRDNPDYTAIINQRHIERLRGLIEDARAKGAEIVEINPAHENFAAAPHRRLPPTLVLGATPDMRVMQEEIFGPVLPILSYARFEDAIARINAGPRPLALYYFGEDEHEREALLTRTHSGGVTINDVIFHFSMDDLPFGGVGPSGMGAYHGRRGFEEFSHQKAVYHQTTRDILAFLRPPYGATFKRQLASRLKG